MDLKTSLHQEANEVAPWLSELGFQVVEDSLTPEHFGNSTLTLSSARFLVRFSRDRGDTATYVASLDDPTEWWLIDFVLEVIRGEENEFPKLELHVGAELLREHFEQLSVALGPNYAQTKETLRLRSPQRIDRMLTFARNQRQALEESAVPRRDGSIWNLR
jgi:hypothetical protein